MSEIAEQVAEKVMGWRWYSQRGKAGRNMEGQRVFHFAPPDYEVPKHWKNVVDDKPTGAPNEYLCHVPRPPAYDTDPAADYSVLVKVRETWKLDDLRLFWDALQHIWGERFHARTKKPHERVGLAVRLCMCYEPGDYSRAALAALSARAKA